MRARDDREPPPRPPDGHVPDDACDRDLLLGQEVGDPALGRRRLVPARRVAEQVVDRAAGRAFATALGGRRPHSTQRVERARERLGAARCARSRPLRRPFRHGEAGRQPSHRAESRDARLRLRSSNQKKPTAPGPGVRADDGARASRTPRSGRSARTSPTMSRNACSRSGASACAIATLQRRSILRVLLERLPELGERLLVPAHALDRDDLAVLDREDRLDRQQLARPGLRTADTPAAGEKLERLDGEDEAGLPLERLDQSTSISSSVVPRSSRRLQSEPEQRDAERCRLGVDDADPLSQPAHPRRASRSPTFRRTSRTDGASRSVRRPRAPRIPRRSRRESAATSSA